MALVLMLVRCDSRVTIYVSQFCITDQIQRAIQIGRKVYIYGEQVFFAVLRASGNIRSVINTGTTIFIFALLQIMIHLGVLLGI